MVLWNILPNLIIFTRMENRLGIFYFSFIWIYFLWLFREKASVCSQGWPQTQELFFWVSWIVELPICARISETRLGNLMRGKENHTTAVPYVWLFICFCVFLLIFFETRNNVVQDVFKYTVFNSISSYKFHAMLRIEHMVYCILGRHCW